jgi:hypothetical protein
MVVARGFGRQLLDLTVLLGELSVYDPERGMIVEEIEGLILEG